MQFYLVQRPQDYFTFVAKISPTYALFDNPYFKSTPLRPSRVQLGRGTLAYPRDFTSPRASTNSFADFATCITTKIKSLTGRQRLIAFLLGAMSLGVTTPLISPNMTHQKFNLSAVIPTNSTLITAGMTTKQDIVIPTLQKILAQKMLILAVADNAVDDDTGMDVNPRFLHDYGQAIAQQLATQLGVTLSVTHYATLAQAQQAVTTGKADMVMTPASQPSATQFLAGIPAADIVRTAYHSRKNTTTVTANTHGLVTVNISPSDSDHTSASIAWQMPPSDDQFPNQVQDFLRHHKAQHDTLWDFYTQNMLQNSFNQAHFSETVMQTLPRLKPIFQQNAQAYHHDWKMLAAVGYQESHLRADAVSPTGVRGIMMLTNDTAKAMGVSNRTDPYQSIKGGAKYLEMLQNQFADVPESDRLWFSLAAYNMGPMAILNIQDKLRQTGKDATSWAEVYHYMMVNKKSTPRYTQCMDYVSNIHGYLTLLNQSKPVPAPPVTQTA